MDILCHALESYTARPYTTYERKRPEQRVPYNGANPIADMWSEKALSLLAGSFRRAVRTARTPRPAGDGDGRDLRRLGFGNAGVHIPHANAYPIAGRVKDFHPKDYPGRRADGARTACRWP
jgi:alcohol dehydrogenase class IV